MSKTEILYNGSCPICSKEIEAYRRSADARDLPLTFHDLADTDLTAWGLDADRAARRFHVRRSGEILVGLEAFRALWVEIPHLRWLARVAGLPLIRPMAHLIYDRVLAPILYASHRRRQARARRKEPQGQSHVHD